MDIVSEVAAITAVSGLAVKLYKILNEIIHDISVVPDYLVVLKSQLYIFIFSLRHLRRYVRKRSVPKSHVQEINIGLEGGKTIIEQINKQLSAIRFEEVKVNGKIVRKVPPWDRLQTWLNEELITKWTNQLTAHCGPLELLLRSQELDPTDSDDELSIELSYSTPLIDEPAIKEWVQEEDPPENKNSWWPSLKQKAQKVKDGSIQLRQQYHQLLSMKSQEFNDWRLCVVVLGRGGVGKTRLSSYVCDLPYVDDTLTGEKTPPERILKAMNMEQTKRLALHDSGGLEGSRTVDFVRSFISATQKLPVRDQIHAIWYVISCKDPKRAVAQTDEEFLAGELIDTGEIPIFIVFSQYDELKSYVRKELQKKHLIASEDQINRETYKQFNDKIYKQAMKFIKDKDKSKFSFSRVGIRDDGSEYLQPDDGGPVFGLENLTKQIESRLPNGYLQIQFVAIQQKDDRAKLYDSINTSIALLFTARTFTKWSIGPGICLFGVTGVYYLILNIAANFWKIQEWKESLSLRVLRAIFDQDRFDQYGSINMLALNIAGSLTMSKISQITLQMIVGINLIGRRIFRLQALSKTPLTREIIKAEIADFQKSKDRKRLAEVITPNRMAQIDYKTSEAVNEVSQVAQEALEASVGFVDASFFSKERLRIMKELSTVGVAH